MKVSKTDAIQKAERNLFTAKKTRRSLKNEKETLLEQKARIKLENLNKDFEGEKKKNIAKKRYQVQQEKKVF